jgi:hypothetical protein
MVYFLCWLAAARDGGDIVSWEPDKVRVAGRVAGWCTR